MSFSKCTSDQLPVLLKALQGLPIALGIKTVLPKRTHNDLPALVWTPCSLKTIFRGLTLVSWASHVLFYPKSCSLCREFCWQLSVWLAMPHPSDLHLNVTSSRKHLCPHKADYTFPIVPFDSLVVLTHDWNVLCISVLVWLMSVSPTRGWFSWTPGRHLFPSPLHIYHQVQHPRDVCWVNEWMSKWLKLRVTARKS